MARTAPAPNIPPIPGMCPSIAVLAGGGDMGSGGGDGAGDGSGDASAGAGKGGENAEADKRGAPDYQKYPECGYASHPVDVVTGRAFTHPATDLLLPGPLDLEFRRMYSSKVAHLDMGLGYGWAHSFGWKVEVKRRSVVVWNEQGIAVDFPLLRPGEESIGPWGWVLRREAWGFAVDAGDGLWRLFSEADPKQSGFHLLTAVEDRNRNRISLTYDDGRLVEIKDSVGRVVRVGVTREGRIASLSALNAVAQGQWVAFATYLYDEQGNLSAVTDADGHTARFAYDEEHRLTLDQDRSGLAFHFVYDRQGRCIESWGDYPGRRDPSLGEHTPRLLADQKTRLKGIHHCKFEYGDDGYSEVADATEVRRFFGNKHGTLDKRVEGGGVVTARYDDDGHLLARTDALGGTVSYARDARGRILTLIDVMGRVTSFTRDAAGLPLTITDPAGGVVAYTRDRFGNAETMTDECGGVTTYRWDARGMLIERVEPNGERTRIERDDHGNMIALHQQSGGVWRHTWDALGRRLSRTDPLGATTRYGYSARGDLLAVYDPGGGVTRYDYDGEGQLVRVTSPGGRITELTWGGYHQLCGARDAAGHLVRIVYDTEGQALAVENEAGEQYRFEYTTRGRISSEETFDGVVTRFKYDAEGRVIEIRDAQGGKTTLTRNLAGDVVERTLPDGGSDTFEYDPLGNVIAAISGKVEVRLERDACGRILRETQAVNGAEESIEVRYDPAGRRVHRSTSRGHVEERLSGAGADRVLLDGRFELRFVRDLLGREVTRHLPTGVAIETEIDPGGRLTRRRVRSPSATRALRPGEPEWLGKRLDGVTVDRAYSYDRDGELRSVHDAARGSIEYEYDPIGQLLSAAPERARPMLYRFDAVGNLHESSAGAEPRRYERGSRLVEKGDSEYRWNALGQLVEKRTRARGATTAQVIEYAWSATGQLASVTAADGTLVRFTYDAFGRRLEKQVSRGAAHSRTRFVWDADVLVHEVRESSAQGGDPVVEERTYCFEDDGFTPLAHKDVRRGGGADDVAGEPAWYQYLNDPSGAPEQLVGPDGEIACDLARTPWRADSPAGAGTGTPIRFQGQYEDAETGLYYNRFRYYDPDTGRYISHDPLGIDGGLNLYRYAENPFTHVDPLGLAGYCTCKITTRGGEVFEGKSGRRKADDPHHDAVQDTIDRDHTTEKGKGKTVPQKKGECAEPNVISDYLKARGVEPGDKKGLKKALRDIATIEPTVSKTGEPKEVCPYCRQFLRKLGGRKLLKKVKPASLIY